MNEYVEPIKYEKTKWPYVLSETYIFYLNRTLKFRDRDQDVITHPYMWLCRDYVQIREGYAWDGPSGPTFDTENSIRASLLHDAIYQAIREKLIPPRNRRIADAEFRDVLRADGMDFIRRWVWWIAVRLFGGRVVNKNNLTMGE